MNSPPLTAFVLAGGKSRRMGQDKALLQYQGHYLVEYPIRVLRQITQDVRIVGDSAKYSFLGLPVVPDSVESKGPLSGIYSALKISPSDYNLFLACDMPLMRAEFFSLLLARIHGNDAIVMRFEDGTMEPLCSIYRSSCLAEIEVYFSSKKFKISDFFVFKCVPSLLHYSRPTYVARLLPNFSSSGRAASCACRRSSTWC